MAFNVRQVAPLLQPEHHNKHLASCVNLSLHILYTQKLHSTSRKWYTPGTNNKSTIKATTAGPESIGVFPRYAIFEDFRLVIIWNLAPIQSERDSCDDRVPRTLATIEFPS